MSPRGARAAIATALLALASGAGTTGCAAETDEGAADDGATEADAALVNGSPARAGQFPATLFMNGACTAAKVAPKLVLTAAHCVYDAFAREATYKPGSTFSYQRDPKAPAKSAIVKDVKVHPTWLAACGATYCTDNTLTAKIDAADVAVIELESELEGVATARIETTPLARGDRVVVLGFGCEEGAQKEQALETRQLKFAETSVLPVTRALHDGSPVTREDLARVGATYALTGGPGLLDAKAGLCPGDSGGPVYRWRGSELVVVGVNSNFTFKATDTVGLAVTNWHTRLDDASRHRISGWLREAGAVAP